MSNQILSSDRNVTNLYDLFPSNTCLTNRNNNDIQTKGKDLYKTPGRTIPVRIGNVDPFPDSAFENILKTPIQKFNNFSNIKRSTNIDCFISPPNNTNRIPIRYGPKSHLLMTTSTPAPSNGPLLTPVVDKNNSMSPITRSTQRMPKAMQVTAMSVKIFFFAVWSGFLAQHGLILFKEFCVIFFVCGDFDKIEID